MLKVSYITTANRMNFPELLSDMYLKAQENYGIKIESLLRYEQGIHRIQYVPVFETKHRIHTSLLRVSFDNFNSNKLRTYNFAHKYVFDYRANRSYDLTRILGGDLTQIYKDIELL